MHGALGEPVTALHAYIPAHSPTMRGTGRISTSAALLSCPREPYLAWACSVLQAVPDPLESKCVKGKQEAMRDGEELLG